MRYALDAPTFLLIARHQREVTHQLVAPNSLRTRALELLLAEVRGGRLDERDALQLHERLTELKVRLLGDRVSRRLAWDLARAHDWPDLRDAEYLAVAKLQADALVTVDARLAERAEGVVQLASVEDLYARPPASGDEEGQPRAGVTAQSPLPRVGAPALRALNGAGYHCLEDLAGVSREALLALHGLGPRAIRILDESMSGTRWSLRD